MMRHQLHHTPRWNQRARSKCVGEGGGSGGGVGEVSGNSGMAMTVCQLPLPIIGTNGNFRGGGDGNFFSSFGKQNQRNA